jgi:hypothetical protein
MTICNIALGTDRALVVTDELVSGVDEQLMVSKALPIPHLQLVVAGCGYHRILNCAMRAALEPMPPNSGIADLAAQLPELLSALWRAMQDRVGKQLDGRSVVLLIGVTTDDAIAAIAFESPEFAARRLEPGLYLQPRLASPQEGQETEPTPEGSEVLSHAPAPTPVSPSWQDLVYSARAAIPIQFERREVAIGGRATETYVDIAQLSSTRWGDIASE